MKSKLTPYYLNIPSQRRIPFVLSIPHCGTEFPKELEDHYDQNQVEKLDDTDWYLDQLYDFANRLGITVVFAKYSRWVIDLNRERDSRPLYDDGRIITDLCPTTTFLGENIYRDKRFEPSVAEKERRLSLFYDPYHQKIDEIIADLRGEFNNVVFWDAHSIRRNVATIQTGPFPDMILGDDTGRTADRKYIDIVLNSLRSCAFDVSHNDPFKGGFSDPFERESAKQYTCAPARDE